MDYDSLRHFADSWGLVYMVAIFLVAIVSVLRPSARQHAHDAALIPFRDNAAPKEDAQP